MAKTGTDPSGMPSMRESRPMTVRIALVIVMVLLVVLGLSASANAQIPEFTFVSPDQVALTGSDDSSGKISVWLKNTSAKEVTPEFVASLEDADGHAIPAEDASVVTVDDEDNPVDPPPLAANDVARYRLYLKGSAADEDGSGQLVATGAGVAAASVSLSVGPDSNITRGVDAALVIPFAAAFVLILIAVFAVVMPVSLASPLGTLDFDFSQSFASTLTAVGALLGTIISAGVLADETVNLSKEAFTALNLLFGVAIVAAAIVYSACQKAVWEDDPNDGDKQIRQLQGYVGPFLLACLITAWAVFGELWVSWLLVDELGESNGLTSFAVDVFKALLIVAAVAMAFYTLWRIQTVVKSERDKPAAGAAEDAFGPPRPKPLKRVTLL
jgi:hypothetical protein